MCAKATYALVTRRLQQRGTKVQLKLHYCDFFGGFAVQQTAQQNLQQIESCTTSPQQSITKSYSLFNCMYDESVTSPQRIEVMEFVTGDGNVSSHEGTLAPPGEFD